VSAADCLDLESLREHIGDCHRCPLGSARTQVVFGVGDPRAELMFIGEGPGKNEDLQGEPFVGAAGKFLDELLASIGLVRSQVYIANVVKCRPPENRDPEALEIEACTPFLSRQIELIDPKVIATLGNFATKYVLDTTVGITRLRGRLYRVGGRCVVPVLHPAAALYNGSNRQVLFDDFRRLRTVLDRDDGPVADSVEAEPIGAPAESDSVESEPAGESVEMAEAAAAVAPESEQPRLF
jgi:uracil-DNA glycosylase family 4